MESIFIITNNPKVRDEVKSIEVYYYEVGYIEVLEEVRDLLHKNYKLISHPLYGSVKPFETKYRTIIVEKSNVLDLNSVSLIEEAIETAKKFLSFFDNSEYTESVLDDLQVVDLDIMNNALNRIN